MWMDDMFRVKKPIIALLHLRALPGDPLYQRGDSMAGVVRTAREELRLLQDGGVDGVLVANEFSLPHQRRVSYVTVAAMAYVIGEIRSEVRVPLGVNIAMNPMAALELAAAVEADFIRGSFTGAYMGEGGILDTDVAEVLRRRKSLGLDSLRMLFKLNPEADVYLAERPVAKIAKSIIFRCAPDALCVSGASAGAETDTELMAQVREAAGSTPILCNTGCSISNIVEKLSISDGACVGTSFKKDGKFENTVDGMRVREFMDTVKKYRKTL